MVNLLWKKVQPVKVTKLTFDLLVKVYLPPYLYGVGLPHHS